MDRKSAESMVTRDIEQLLDALSPNGAPITRQRLELAMPKLAHQAFEHGRIYALSSLLTVEDVAQRLHTSPQRIRTIARAKHAQLGIGARIGGQWFFTPEEVESLRPGPPGRPRRNTEEASCTANSDDVVLCDG